MDTQSLITRLHNEYHYPSQGAMLVADKLLQSTPQIKALFEKFWENGELPDMSVEGYSFQTLMQEHGINPIAAFLTLDWLIREPEKAKQSLHKGHDIVQRKQ